jgi:dTDP-4-dehydrorhamnose reductase
VSGRILVIGRSGQLATALQRIGGDAVDAWGSDRFDLAETATMLEKLRQSGAQAVINAGGYTAVDRAENDREKAFALNRDGIAALAEACAKLTLPLVHLSSDYVFDGAKDGAYVESDRRAPINVYGQSKAEGEDAVLRQGGSVIRTSWVFAAYGHNFLRTMLALAEKSDRVSVVVDQVGRPTSAEDLARACLALAERRDASGEVFHFAGADDATWAEFADGIFAEAAARGLKSARVSRILSAEYPAAATRPANSRLESSKFTALTGVAPRPWREALSLCMDQIAPLRTAN